MRSRRLKSDAEVAEDSLGGTHRARPTITIIALSAITIVSVIEFPAIEAQRPEQYTATPTLVGPSLIDEAVATNELAQVWYSVHNTLGERATGARVVVPVNAAFANDRFVSGLYSYGAATSVERARYSGSIDALDDVLTDEGQGLLAAGVEPMVLEGSGQDGFETWTLLTSSSAVTGSATVLVAFTLAQDESVELFLIEDSLLTPEARAGI
ncbi:MAG: hypothetical protein KJ659_06140 [Actinobacteria bacterium]|nr:hypothetical protein [Actinomycetota bacterium]MBU1609337.1 hypothetical protein [Actinomycetota bacterium]MBU2314969.1 hypothetical protein [Actinomycetota bacterium]MBU2385065.1 hypothetical protein [Actinomycetota bacterium]